MVDGLAMVSPFIEFLALPLCAIVGGGLVMAFLTSVAGRTRDKRVTSRSNGQKLEEIYVLMKGREPTDFEPNPPPGMVAQLVDVAGRVTRIETTLTTNGFKGDTIKDDLQQIRHNTRPVGGETRPKRGPDGTYS